MINKFLKEVPESACRFVLPGEFKASETSDGEFQLIPYSGQIFSHWFWGKLAFDISGMRASKEVIPALLDHDRSKVVGAIDSSSFENQITFQGSFEDTQAAKEVQSLKKVPWECSLAFDLDQAVIEEVGSNAKADVNGQVFEGPGYIVREAPIYECSFTLFGAVPGTSAEAFDQSSRMVSVNVFKKGATVPPKTETQSDVDIEQLEADSKAKGQAEALNTFQEMLEICPDKPDLVQELFKNNVSMSEFKSNYISQLREENEQLKQQLAEKLETPETEGADPVTFSSSEGKDGPKSFMDAAKELAKTEGINIGEALSKIARENPELYNKHNPLALSK